MSIDECGRYRTECEVSEQKGDILSPEHGSVVASANRSLTKKLVSYFISSQGLMHI